MQAFSKLICAKLSIDWTFAPVSSAVNLFMLRKLAEEQGEFIRTQHLHLVAWSG